MRWKQALWVIDFDKTVTWKDTIGILGRFGLAHSSCEKPWSYFTEAYLADASHHTGPAVQDLGSFCDYLESYRPIELASIGRINQHGVFSGLTEAMLFEHGQTLGPEVIRAEALSVLKELDQVKILSVNWSKGWIQGCLDPLGIACTAIEANKIVQGRIEPSLVTTRDKAQRFQLLRQDQPTVYVGDSLGDLEPLLLADRAIVIGQDTALLSALSKYQIPFYAAKGWSDILGLIEKD